MVACTQLACRAIGGVLPDSSLLSQAGLMLRAVELPMPRAVLRTEVPASAELIWSAMRWMRALARCNPWVRQIAAGHDANGTTSTFDVAGVGRVFERLEHSATGGLTCFYSAHGPMLPARRFIARLRIDESDAGTSIVEWDNVPVAGASVEAAWQRDCSDSRSNDFAKRERAAHSHAGDIIAKPDVAVMSR